MIQAAEPDLTLMALWARNKSACRPVGGIVADARSGRLPGIESLASGFGYRVTGDEEWSRDLHAQGQLFLQYAIGDIEAIAAAQVQRSLPRLCSTRTILSTEAKHDAKSRAETESGCR